MLIFVLRLSVSEVGCDVASVYVLLDMHMCIDCAEARGGLCVPSSTTLLSYFETGFLH